MGRPPVPPEGDKDRRRRGWRVVVWPGKRGQLSLCLRLQSALQFLPFWDAVKLAWAKAGEAVEDGQADVISTPNWERAERVRHQLTQNRIAAEIR